MENLTQKVDLRWDFFYYILSLQYIRPCGYFLFLKDK